MSNPTLTEANTVTTEAAVQAMDASTAASGTPAATSAAHGQRSELVASHLEKSYGKRKVVKDVSITLRNGEVVGLLGPNGAGKTTSFYMIVGLLRADGGSITIDGQRVEDMPIHLRSRMGLSMMAKRG